MSVLFLLDDLSTCQTMKCFSMVNCCGFTPSNWTTSIIVSIQIPFQPPKTSINGFFESIEELLNKLWAGFADFITGKSCRYCISSSRSISLLCQILEHIFELHNLLPLLAKKEYIVILFVVYRVFVFVFLLVRFPV